MDDFEDKDKPAEDEGNTSESATPVRDAIRRLVDIVASDDAQITFPASPAKQKGKEPMPEDKRQEDKGNEEFPIPCQSFVNSLHDTADEVWGHWLKRVHGRENHKPKDWSSLLDSHKDGSHSSLNSK